MFDFTKIHKAPKEEKKPLDAYSIRQRPENEDTDELPPVDPNVKPIKLPDGTIKVGNHIIKTSTNRPDGLYKIDSELGLDEQGNPTGQFKPKPEDDK